jgi:hypothetical protein
MYRSNIARIFGLTAAAVLMLMGTVVSQAQQKSAKELIAGNWTLMIADNVRGDGNKVPGIRSTSEGHRHVRS